MHFQIMTTFSPNLLQKNCHYNLFKRTFRETVVQILVQVERLD